jgi:hypothetical protein
MGVGGINSSNLKEIDRGSSVLFFLKGIPGVFHDSLEISSCWRSLASHQGGMKAVLDT